MLRLKCVAQCYAWGRPAPSSEVILFTNTICSDGNSCAVRGSPIVAGEQVASLARADGVEVDDSKPYAELWCDSLTPTFTPTSGCRCNCSAAVGPTQSHHARGSRNRNSSVRHVGTAFFAPLRPPQAAFACWWFALIGDATLEHGVLDRP